MEKYFEILQKCLLFHGVAEEDMASMLKCLGAKIVSFDKKETIIAEGDPARDVGIVLSGAAHIVRVDYFGNRSMLMKIKPSELFGETFSCAGVEEIPVSVVADGRTEILLMDCRRITRSCRHACQFHRQMIYNLMKVVATKNLVYDEKIEIISKRTTREKLMTYLLQQAKRNKSNCFEIPYDRQELADYLEVERSGLSAEIGRLRREGVIDSRRSYFELYAAEKKERQSSLSHTAV